ncbi:MAG: hypothetical protein ACLGIS_18125 [Actinomycetes bacterium]
MTAIERAEKALIKAMGEKPARLSPGSVEVVGRNVSWEETCRSSIKRGGDRCLHARYSIAPADAVEAFFEAAGVAA